MRDSIYIKNTYEVCCHNTSHNNYATFIAHRAHYLFWHTSYWCTFSQKTPNRKEFQKKLEL